MTLKLYVESKDDIIEKTTDDRGRLLLGAEYANTDVQVAILDADRDDDEE